MQSWLAVVEVTKSALTQNDPALVWGVDVANCVHEVGIGLPSVDLSVVLLHHLFASGGSAAMWSYIRYAMSAHMVSALHMLALLTQRCSFTLPSFSSFSEDHGGRNFAL